MTSDSDNFGYLHSEAERLPNGTAAKALRAMQSDPVTLTLSRKNVTNLSIKLRGLIGWQGEVCDACLDALDGER